MSIVRTLHLRPTTCLAGSAAALVAAGTSVIIASAPLPAAADLRPLPAVAAGVEASTPATGPVGVGVTVDAEPLVRSTTRTATRTAAAAADTATGTVQDALGTATSAVETTVPLALDTAGTAVRTAVDTAGTALATADAAVDTAVELAGSPVSGTVVLCPGAVVSTGAQVRVGDLLVLHAVAPTATLAAAGALVTDTADGVSLDRRGASVSTPQVQPDRLVGAAGADAAASTRLVPVRIGVGADWRTATADGAARASTGAGPLSLATTAATCSPVDWSLVR